MRRSHSYEDFSAALNAVYERVSKGKGRVHQGQMNRLEDDTIWRIRGLLGLDWEGFPAGQAIKDVQEFLRTGRREKLLDAAAYLMFLYMEAPDPRPPAPPGAGPMEGCG